METRSDETEIRAVIDQWLKATAFRDLEQILSLMTDDVVFLLPGQTPMVGKEAFADAFRAIPASSKIEGSTDILEIRISGDHAYVWTQLAIMITPEGSGEPIRRAGSTLSIFRRDEDTSWKLARDANLLFET